MHAILIALGSHGDVHPFVGIGERLRQRGHRVTVVTNEHFAAMVARAGLEFAQLGTDEDFLRVTNMPELWDPMKGFRLVMSMMGEAVRPLYDILAARHEPGETIAAAPVTAWGARLAQEKLGLPLVTVDLQPSVLFSAIDPPELPIAPLMRILPMWGRRALLTFANRHMIDPVIAPPINAVRAGLGLRPVREVTNWWHSPQLVLGLFPDWFAAPQADWPPNTHLPGFPLFDEATHQVLEPEVEAFLRAGPAPIVFTAGSAMKHGHEFFQAAADACERLGRRGALLARFDDQIPRNLPPTVRHFSYVPFSLLLPRAAALVHHGGIGTTAQGLAAGIPQLVMPLAHDQPDNAMRLKRLGVGASLDPKKFRGEAVARILETLLADPAVSQRASELAQRVRQVDAIGQACDLIESTHESARGVQRAEPSTTV